MTEDSEPEGMAETPEFEEQLKKMLDEAANAIQQGASTVDMSPAQVLVQRAKESMVLAAMAQIVEVVGDAVNLFSSGQRVEATEKVLKCMTGLENVAKAITLLMTQDEQNEMVRRQLQIMAEVGMPREAAESILTAAAEAGYQVSLDALDGVNFRGGQEQNDQVVRDAIDDLKSLDARNVFKGYL